MGDESRASYLRRFAKTAMGQLRLPKPEFDLLSVPSRENTIAAFTRYYWRQVREHLCRQSPEVLGKLVAGAKGMKDDAHAAIETFDHWNATSYPFTGAIRMMAEDGWVLDPANWGIVTLRNLATAAVVTEMGDIAWNNAERAKLRKSREEAIADGI